MLASGHGSIIADSPDTGVGEPASFLRLLPSGVPVAWFPFDVVPHGVYVGKTLTTVRILDSFWQDLRFAVRSLRTRPRFTATVVLTLATGMAMSTTMYSFVHGVLIQPLPFRDQDRIVAGVSRVTRRGPPFESRPGALLEIDAVLPTGSERFWARCKKAPSRTSCC